ncbi:transposable element Tcb2 transposase [Trichonephila clavipes]|nr:transposable element Tcb2 transposase [Trichonephila clavipes]
MVCVRLTARHRRDRMEWATEHVNWRINEWSNVLFSDESRFSVHPDNRRIFNWRDRGSRNNPAFVHKSARFGDGDDNCRPHRANLVEDYFFDEGIVRMEWPTCSPDMNPRARLGLSRKTSCWPPTITANSPRTGKKNSGRVGQNTLICD